MSGNFLETTWLKPLVIPLTALSLGACEQMTRHSNTLVFATSTVDGLKVGVDVDQKPTIQLALSRQELAVVPVLANTGTSGSAGNLSPCPAGPNIEKCKFIATHDGNNVDSYSTLASFGSEKGAEVDAAGKAKGTASVAQYFATGVAAQYLAITGGANIVTAGGDTDAKARAASEAAAQLAEKARAEAATAYASGQDVALVMLGNDPNAVLDVNTQAFKDLEAKMGSGCNHSRLAARNFFSKNGKPTPTSGTLSVKDYLDVLLKERPACFYNLQPKAA